MTTREAYVDEYVQRALAARARQGLPEAIEDPATLAFLADILTATPERSTTKKP